MPKSTFYITTPLYYVNAPPHFGGAYTTIVADTIARYKRMMGFDVKLLSGTDEHGQKIERSAKAQGIEPKALADGVYEQYKKLWNQLGIQYDEFIRTTEPRHDAAVYELYNRCKANGFIYKSEYAGWYCVSCEAYAPETDPAKPADCPDCGRKTEWMAEESYFFKLSAFQDRLLAFYESNPSFVQPRTRLNEIVSFVKGGLKDLSISRVTLKWGIPLPDDPKHVFYVWFDALTGYMSGIDFKTDDAKFSKYWPANVHLVGKDILRFHAVYWPAFLLAAGLEPPRKIFAHGHWLSQQGEKMSKSRGNTLNPYQLETVFGSELLRYFVLREMVFGQDCNFSFDAVIQRSNSDLANDLGNLLSRTMAMIAKYRKNQIPSSGEATGDSDVRALAAKAIANFVAQMDEFNFSRALESVWELISRVNKYIVENEPWSLAEKPAESGRLDSVLFHCAESLRIIAVLLAPVMPISAQTIWRQLGLEGEVSGVALNLLEWSGEVAGKTIQAGTALFPRVDAKEIYKRLESGNGASAPPAAPAAGAAEASPLAPVITIDDFAKVDLRAGTVVEAERVKGADKLLRLIVDLGFEKRQVLAGIAKVYDPEKLIGRKVVVVANLQPRKLRGLESNGMIVAASLGNEDPPILAGFLEDTPNGARLK
jgi:methionyl-tRNA synthetase